MCHSKTAYTLNPKSTDSSKDVSAQRKIHNSSIFVAAVIAFASLQSSFASQVESEPGTNCTTQIKKRLLALTQPGSTLPHASDRIAHFKESLAEADRQKWDALETSRLQEQFSEIQAKRPWSDWIDPEADYMRFIESYTYLNKKPYVSGSELYGKPVYLAWKKADNRLKSIPRGELVLDRKLIREIHDLATPSFFTELTEKYGKLGKLPAGLLTALRSNANFLLRPLKRPLSEHAYESVLGNPLLKFIELPFPLSRKGARRGIISCVDHDQITIEMNKLLSWYNENKDKADPIHLAAQFQRRLVSIHPFVDGNGRTSRLIMDRILAEHDLPPALIRDMDMDLYLSPQEWEASVRQGVFAHLEIIRTNKGPRPPPISVGTGPMRLPKNPALSYLELTGKDFQIGSQGFRLGQDGFLYSNEGIPHVFHDGQLFPVSDRAYFLYGKKSSGMAGATVSDAYRDVIQSNYRLIRKIQDKAVDAKSIRIQSYRAIDSSNKSSRLTLYPWQKQLFREAITIEEKLPERVLNRNLSPQNRYEFVHSGKESKPSGASQLSHMIAQYETMDREFYDYLNLAKNDFPDLVPEVISSRKKLHLAARQLLEPFLKELETLTPAQRKELDQFPRFRAVQEYLSRSKLGYRTYEDAMRSVDDNQMILFRNEMIHARLLGFNSAKTYNDFFFKLPGHQGFLKLVRYFYYEVWLPKILPKYKKNPEELEKLLQWKDIERDLPPQIATEASKLGKVVGRVDELLRRVIRNFILERDVPANSDEAFKRAYVDHVLHTSDYGLKKNISFTSSPAYLIPDGIEKISGLKFTPGAGTFADVYLVSVPKDSAHWNYSNDWFNAYEFLVDRSVPSSAILKVFKGKELLNADLSTYSEQAQDFVSRWLNGPF